MKIKRIGRWTCFRADTDAQVQEAGLFAVADLLNLEVDLLFSDTTSTYFERDTEDLDPDGDAEDGSSGFRRYGHSKDHRKDLPQIIIGLAVTREGIPVRCWCWPGNTGDQAILPEVKDGLRGWRLGRASTAVDRGFSSRENLAYLQRAGGHYIAGERMRDGNAHAHEALARQGRYQQVRDNLRVKEVRIGSTPGIRWIICHNPEEAERDQAARDTAIARISAELDRITTARTRAREQARARRTASAAMSAAARTKADRKADLDEAAHVKADGARVRVDEDRVERLVDRVRQDVGAAHHRDAEDDRKCGENGPELPASEALERESDHPVVSSSIVASTVCGSEAGRSRTISPSARKRIRSRTRRRGLVRDDHRRRP